MANNDKVVIDEKKFRKEQIKRQRSTDKKYIKKVNVYKIVGAAAIIIASLTVLILVIVFTNGKPYYGFIWWALIMALYLSNKARKIIKKSLSEIKKLDNPFNFG